MDKVIESEVTHPQMAGAKGSSCSMPACDGMAMKDEKGVDIEPYKVGDYDDEVPNFSIGALPLLAPKGNNMSMMKKGQNGEFDHNRWLFETNGTYGYGNAFWPQDDIYGDGGDEGFKGGIPDNSDKP
ncbi:hypothetical protein Patl1_37400 [Pistacia atlantica]|nr:hypothetical protein Patl1_37400 [Pistacia atlantica]